MPWRGSHAPVSILLCPFQYLYVAVTVLTHLCLIFDAYSRMGQWWAPPTNVINALKSWHWHHTWVGFVVGSLPCSGRFFSGHCGFPLSLETIHSKFQFDQDRCRTGPCGCATSQSLYFIYFICLIPLFQGHNYVLTWMLPFRINVP